VGGADDYEEIMVKLLARVNRRNYEKNCYNNTTDNSYS
jgi:hypothetical protein